MGYLLMIWKTGACIGLTGLIVYRIFCLQIQRGLGASKLAVRFCWWNYSTSLTKATDKQRGGFVKADVGNDSITD